MVDVSRTARGLAIRHDGETLDRVSWPALQAAATLLTPPLEAAGVTEGSSVLLLGPPSVGLFAAIEAVWALGAAVHLQAFWIREDPTHLAAATVTKMQLLGSTVAVLGSVPAEVSTALHEADGLAVVELSTCDIEQAANASAARATAPVFDPPPNQVAIWQASSGTTGTPRLLPISWGMVRANLTSIVTGFGLLDDGAERFGSWPPLFHDMGLIGFYVLPRLMGAATTIMSTESFVVSPLAWLEMLSEDGTTTTGAPSSALAMVTRYLQRSRTSFDLSALRRLVVAAEMIDVDAVEEFAAVAAATASIAARSPSPTGWPRPPSRPPRDSNALQMSATQAVLDVVAGEPRNATTRNRPADREGRPRGRRTDGGRGRATW